VLENLYGEWKDDQLHVQPMLAWFRRSMGAAALPAEMAGMEMPLPEAAESL